MHHVLTADGLKMEKEHGKRTSEKEKKKTHNCSFSRGRYSERNETQPILRLNLLTSYYATSPDPPAIMAIFILVL